MEKDLAFQGALDRAVEFKNFISILGVATLMTFSLESVGDLQWAFLANVDRKADIFPIDGDVISDIFYSAFIMTAYQFQEEIEKTSKKKLSPVCKFLTDRDGFFKKVMTTLDDCVTLPSEVETTEDLVGHAGDYYSTRAVTNSFVKSVRVIREMPNYYECLQCWVCGANDTQNCVAAYCSRECLKKA